MAEPLTNAILASILHLIRWDLTGNGIVPPCRAPPRWIPPRRAPARLWCRWPHRSGPRAVTPPSRYQSMEPSPPGVPEQSQPGPLLPPFGTPYIPRTHVDLGRLAGTVARARVEACTGTTQDERKKIISEHVVGSMTLHDIAKTCSRRRPPAHRQWDDWKGAVQARNEKAWLG
jgi:hypothetical protein